MSADTASDMVERVARVICEKSGHSPDYVWSDGKPYWDMYIDSARAAIEAMREPTEAMMAAEGENDLGVKRPISGYLDYFSAAQIWRAMIDAALAAGSAPK